jgi:hypothetical protein
MTGFRLARGSLSPATRRAKRAFAASVLVASGSLIGSGRAQEAVDPDLVQHVAVGSLQGASPMPGVNAARSRQASFAFAETFAVGWRARVTGPVALEPVVDDKGHIVLLHERGSLSQLSSTGKLEWSVRLGDAAPSTSPVILSGGVRAILNYDNRLLRLASDGSVLSSTPTGLKGKAIPLLALEDGGLALAVENTLQRLDQHGYPIAQAQTDQRIIELLESPHGVLAVADSGEVFRFEATGKLTAKGGFGHGVRAVALYTSKLYAISSERELLSFDLGTQMVRSLFSAQADRTLEPWIVLSQKGPHVATSDGTLRGLTFSGKERWRLVLGDNQASPGEGAILLGALPPPVADSSARVAVAQAGSETLVVATDGSSQRIAASACLSPTALTPLGRGALLLSCRNGELWALTPSKQLPPQRKRPRGDQSSSIRPESWPEAQW